MELDLHLKCSWAGCSYLLGLGWRAVGVHQQKQQMWWSTGPLYRGCQTKPGGAASLPSLLFTHCRTNIVQAEVFSVWAE